MANYTWHGWDSSNPGKWDDANNFTPSGGPPGAADNVSVPAGSNAITSGLASGTTTRLGRVHFEEGWFEIAGVQSNTGDTYLALNCAFLLLASSGTTYIELNSASDSELCDVEVRNTAPGGNGQFGAYIKSETSTTQGNISDYSQTGGAVIISPKIEDAVIVKTTASVYGGECEFGHGCTLDTSTKLRIKDGSAVFRGVWTNCVVTLEAGAELRSEGASANAQSVTMRGDSSFIPNISSGGADLVSLILYDTAYADFMQSGLPRTVTTLHQIGGRVRADPSAVTVTNLGVTTPDDRTVVPV